VYITHFIFNNYKKKDKFCLCKILPQTYYFTNISTLTLKG